MDAESANEVIDVAVVGGGSVAVAFVHHYVDALSRCTDPGPVGVRITVFEPRNPVGRGSAYAEDLESNLLNVPVSGMSAAADDPDHFKRWLSRCGISMFGGRPVCGDSFVSRPLFGSYLEDVFRTAALNARDVGAVVQHVASTVVAIGPESPDQFHELVTGDGRRYRARHVVLSIGNLAPTNFAEFNGLPGYAADPYPARNVVERIPRDAAVCVLGTSLSAVDAIVALASVEHRGPIFAVSRNGRLPSVRGMLNRKSDLRASFKRRLKTAAATGNRIPLDALVADLQSEFAATGPADGLSELVELLGTLGDAHAFLEREIGISATRPRPWQSFGNALNEVVELLWHVLSDEDRMRFNREIRPLWMSRRVTFPIENARILARMVEAGQLRILGGITGVRHDGNTGEFEVHRTPGVCSPTPSTDGAAPVAGDEDVIRVRHLVNATSFSCDAGRSEMPLLRQLLSDGLARPDAHGGLVADFDSGCLRRADGTPNPRLSALGSMVAGTYFWTNAMEVNARIAMQQAIRIAGERLVPGDDSGIGVQGHPISVA